MNKERLLKIADHLLHGKLGHEVFDFSTFNSWGMDSRVHSEHQCGTKGCAIGEFPILWPNVFEFVFGDVRMKKEKDLGLPFIYTIDCVSGWLEIKIDEAKYLFFPFCSLAELEYPIIDCLPPFATKEQVAARIIDFVNNHPNIYKK